MVWIPSEFEMKEKEIKFEHIVQNSGDAIYAAHNSIHWVNAPVKIYLFLIIFRKEV